MLKAEDLPVRNIREAVENRSIVMALDRVTYVGQPVAIVLAENEAAAEDGSHAVEVEYEPLEPAVDAEAALQPDAPVVRERSKQSDEELGMHGAAAGGQQEPPQAPNVASHQRYDRGDVEAAFADCKVIVEREYRTPWVHQSYLEPQVCAATRRSAGQRRGVRLHAGHVPHPRHGGGRAREGAGPGARASPCPSAAASAASSG